MDPFLVDEFASFPDSSQAAALSEAAAFVPATASASASSASPSVGPGGLLLAAPQSSAPAAVPRDVLDLRALLRSLSLSYEPSVLPVLLDHYHAYTSSLLSYLHSVSSYAGRAEVDDEAVADLITAFTASASPAPPPPALELLLPLAVQRNSAPLPPSRIVKERGEVFLPPDRFLLTRPAYTVDTRPARPAVRAFSAAHNGEHTRETER